MGGRSREGVTFAACIQDYVESGFYVKVFVSMSYFYCFGTSLLGMHVGKLNDAMP